MAKIPSINRLVTEDFQEQKSWIGKLLQPLNTFMSAVSTALNKSLTFEDNIQSQTKEITFYNTTEVPLYFKNEIPRKPSGVIVLHCVSVESATGSELTPIATSVAWEYTQDNRIKITAISNLSAATYYKIRLLVI